MAKHGRRYESNYKRCTHEITEANESLKRIDGRIRDLDSDGSIHFNPKDQSQKSGNYLIVIRHYKNIAEK